MEPSRRIIMDVFVFVHGKCGGIEGDEEREPGLDTLAETSVNGVGQSPTDPNKKCSETDRWFDTLPDNLL